MPKPPLIDRPKRVTIYLSEDTLLRGRSICSMQNTSLSRVISDLINASSDSARRVRVNTDFSVSEYETIADVAKKSNLSVEEFVREAARTLVTK